MSEKNLQQKILNTLGSQKDIRLFRNSAGHGVQGDIIPLRNSGDVLVKNARRASFGLCPGSSDLIGIQRIKISPEMVGQEIGRFVALEIKSPSGRLSAEQGAFLEMVRKFGGVAVVAKSVDDALSIQNY